MNASPDRRTMLRGLGAITAGAAATAAGIPAIAAAGPADPAFSLLQAHRAAWARLLETEDRTDDYEALEEAGRAVDDALREIMKTPPTTRAGARAVIEHLVEWDEDGSMETHHYLATLLRSPILPPREAHT
jgi:hypothetical protein